MGPLRVRARGPRFLGAPDVVTARGPLRSARPVLPEGEEGRATRALRVQARGDPAPLAHPAAGRAGARSGGCSRRVVPDRGARGGTARVRVGGRSGAHPETAP